ncbi:hypothetical protein HK099_004963 [Clydaea vesicula]|uniref:J domain-containing protein n=1 Tax=Clydaea vesicula TaxID=447962 RepID=A0AAD5TZV8_9FUNG|nr:hypothetical protein HK099_004963 [Clydaea vesicula]
MNHYENAPLGPDFYEVLGISRNATMDESYRRSALLNHPDKISTLPGHDAQEALEKFQLINRAYEVLHDEKKRKVYDKYGERGIQMFESMGGYSSFMDPNILIYMNYVFLALSFFIGLLIMFPSFISVKVDGKVDWPWPVVFIPAFIADLIVLSLVWVLSKSPEKNHEDREHPDDEPLDDIKKNSFFQRISILSYFLAFALFQVLISLRLQEVVTSSWALVFIPWWIMELFHLLISFIGFITIVKMGKSPSYNAADEETEIHHSRPLSSKEILLQVYDIFINIVLRIIQSILLVLKLDNDQFAPWQLVFLPLYLIGILSFISIILSYRELRSGTGMQTEQIRQEKSAKLLASVVFFIIFGALFYTGLGLLIQRLTSSNGIPSGAVIFIPIFIILSLLFCCFCCCLPCLTRLENPELHREVHQMVPVSSNRRLGWKI